MLKHTSNNPIGASPVLYNLGEIAFQRRCQFVHLGLSVAPATDVAGAGNKGVVITKMINNTNAKSSSGVILISLNVTSELRWENRRMG